ncbi:ATP-dependent DNA helicase DinG [Terrihalobacillus insolitus]|uniref:ATP-dependent DNA helicase DinG n=1 Tax=Terrihalobacillus insolitus TaxID=2950438 RepID=UPI002341B839|nr:ATP-dependent DNA helicase DinG [Terrihalobacillus insolitus]MDC3413025.1 ATP-dependent DNA helicase DinG [Terrihalobacillus insolitus]
MDKFVVVDIETTGQTPSQGDQMIEIGMVMVENGQLVDEYTTLLHPLKEIPSFISNLTGICDQDVVDAPSFKDVADDVLTYFADAYLVAHNVPFDLGFLNYELQSLGHPPIKQPVIDTVELARILLPKAPGYKLGQLSDYLSLQHNDPHRALSDAYVTAKLLLHLFQKMEQLPYETLHQLQRFEQSFKSDLSELLENKMDNASFEEERHDLEIFRGIAVKKEAVATTSEQGILPTFGEMLDEIYPLKGSIDHQIPHYEERTGQRVMSETIFDAFRAKKHALIEAGTGTGKSLAYLLPAIFESVQTGKRIVISTHLTQLQSQLLDKEIPLLKQVLTFPFEVALLKGRQHYISLKKFEKELFSEQQGNYDIVLSKMILLVWLTETTTGDIDEIQLPSSGAILFNRISSEAEGVADPTSPWFSRSFYQRAKRQAQKANVIIVNHALLCTDMTNDFQLLPTYKKAIIDEAHQLEATAAKHFGLKIDYVTIQYLLNNVGKIQEGSLISRLTREHEILDEFYHKSDWNQLLEFTKLETDDLFRSIFRYVTRQMKRKSDYTDVGRVQYRFDNHANTDSKWSVIKEMTARLTFYVRDVIHYLYQFYEKAKQINADLEDEFEELQTHIDRLQEVIDHLEELFLSYNEDDVKWIEIDAHGAKNAVYIYKEPIHVSDRLAEALFQKKESIILTSATLTVNGSFAYIKERLGLTNSEPVTDIVESSYPYEKQVQLMVPNDFPNLKEGKQEAFIYATCEAIYSLATVTNGRMLVLFTSYDMLRKAHKIFKDFMEEQEFIVIAQGISSGSRSRLKKNFQAFDKAILLGTSSFWEGIDIPGEALSCIVIVRLPFQPPNHPTYQAKAEQMKADGKNPFMDVALPNAVIRFRQGFGRLIRASTDRGIVFVCDDRMMKARYGSYFTASIPTVPITYDSTNILIEKASSWL